jgi:hypothetical protein
MFDKYWMVKAWIATEYGLLPNVADQLRTLQA